MMTTDQIEDRAAKALAVLTDSDETCADLQFEAAKAERLYSNSVDAHFLAIEGNIEERKARARKASEEYYLAFMEATRKYRTLANRRQSETIVLEWLRSLNANQRQGGWK